MLKLCILGQTCASLNPPENGALACDKWLYGEYCKMFCESSYDIPRTRKDIAKAMFICTGNGQWNFDTVPDCSRMYFIFILLFCTAILHNQISLSLYS